jgi:hypothetical protein
VECGLSRKTVGASSPAAQNDDASFLLEKAGFRLPGQPGHRGGLAYGVGFFHFGWFGESVANKREDFLVRLASACFALRSCSQRTSSIFLKACSNMGRGDQQPKYWRRVGNQMWIGMARRHLSEENDSKDIWDQIHDGRTLDLA